MRCLLLFLVAWQLSSCALERNVPAAAAGPLDSTLRAAGLSTGKVKFTGPVTLQIGGSGNTATSTAIAKAKAPVAAAPYAVATQPKPQSSTAWRLVAVAGSLVLLLGVWLGAHIGSFPWLTNLKR
jgi:hypothetical protein